MGFLSDILDVGSDILGGTDWTDVIGTGIKYYGGKKELEAKEEAAKQQTKALQEAAKPRSVYDPLGAAIYNPLTDSYEMTTSPQLAALQQGLFTDAMRQRQEVEPYMTRKGFESEVARRSRAEENLIKQATQEALQDVQGKLLKKGTLGTTMGAGALAEVAKRGAEAGISARQSQRGTLSAEIADALNRAQAARTGMLSIGKTPRALADIGQGMAGRSLEATMAGTPSQLAAQQLSASAMSQPYYQLANLFSGAVPKQKEEDTYTMIDGIGVWNP